MAIITDVVCSAGKSGFFFDDQKAIKSAIPQDGFFYCGKPQTTGFNSIRQAGESISIMLILDNGAIAFGDCAAVQYSGAGGRDPVFIAQHFISVIQKHIAPILKGQQLNSFRRLADLCEVIQVDGKPLHTAIRYGVSQAILDAVAKAQSLLPCELIAREYKLPIIAKPVPIFCQSGDDRYTNVDKMIIKQADVLPHGLINNVADKLGNDGSKLLQYIEWLKNRIINFRTNPDYSPVIHIDVYGTIGLIFNNDTEAMAHYLAKAARACHPLKLRIEGPMDVGSRDGQVHALAQLRRCLQSKAIAVEIVADEWCNTLEDTILFADNQAADMIQIKTPDLGGIQNSIEAVLYCKKTGIGAYLGGTCNETDRSAQLCVHAAIATQPIQMLAKPGMGMDEGYMIVCNEMQRILSLLSYRTERVS